MTELCDKKITHETISYDEFVKAIESHNIDSINFKEVIIQKYYIFYYLSKYNQIDNPMKSDC